MKILKIIFDVKNTRKWLIFQEAKNTPKRLIFQEAKNTPKATINFYREFLKKKK